MKFDKKMPMALKKCKKLHNVFYRQLKKKKSNNAIKEH